MDLNKTINTLTTNGFNAEIVESGKDAYNRILELIPQNSEVLTMTSVTLDTIGISQELNESGKYTSIKEKLKGLSRETDNLAMQKLGAAPEYTIGSVHAVTEDGKLIIASNTGSQLPAYVYGSPNVIFVIGQQKVVKDTEEGLRRIYDYVLPLESKRVQSAYGMKESAVNKLLIMNKEVNPQRIKVILVKEDLGF